MRVTYATARAGHCYGYGCMVACVRRAIEWDCSPPIVSTMAFCLLSCIAAVNGRDCSKQNSYNGECALPVVILFHLQYI